MRVLGTAFTLKLGDLELHCTNAPVMIHGDIHNQPNLTRKELARFRKRVRKFKP